MNISTKIVVTLAILSALIVFTPKQSNKSTHYHKLPERLAPVPGII